MRSSLPPPPPPPVRWGLGHVAMTVPLVFGASLLALVIVALVSGIDDDPAAITAATLGQTMVFIGWPLWVSHNLGSGPRHELGFELRLPVDVGFGVAGAIFGLVAGAAVAYVVSLALDVGTGEADNTVVLDNVEGSSWAPLMFVMITLAIPVGEELLFRGLLLRALERRWGPAIALWGSAALFTLPHFTGGGLGPTLVLYSQIFVYGLTLGFLAQRIGRIGPSIVAHVCVNSLVVILVT